MEPICTAVGVAAGIASIVTVIGKSVSCLNRFRDRWKEADLNITLLIGQLQTVRAALQQVEAWMNECQELETDHQRFLTDLEDSLKCCSLLVTYIDDHVSRLNRTPDDQLRRDGKLHVLLEEQITSDYLTRLGHQISALNLCLTAFKCRSPRDQIKLLDKEESQRVLTQVKDDATSLLATLEDRSTRASTRRTSITSVQTQYSKVFNFDGILLNHRIYQKSLRSMLKRAAAASAPLDSSATEPRKLSSGDNFLERTISARDSARIDSLIREDARKLEKEYTILALGSKHEKTAIIKHLRVKHGNAFGPSEIEQHRQSIVALLLSAMIAILDYVDSSGIGLVSQQSREHAQVVRDFATSGGPNWDISEHLSTSIRTVWENWHIKEAFKGMNQNCPAAYFLSSTSRICRPDYRPDTADIINCPDDLDTMRETVLQMDPVVARIAEVKESNLPKLIQCFDGVAACIFALDLTGYDQPSGNEQYKTVLSLQLAYLKSILNSTHLARSAKLIFMANVSAFGRKLAISPFDSFFEDYSGGKSTDAAVKYLVKICKKANRSRLPFFWHVCDVNDESNAQFIRQSIDTIPVATWVKDFGLT